MVVVLLHIRFPSYIQGAALKVLRSPIIRYLDVKKSKKIDYKKCKYIFFFFFSSSSLPFEHFDYTNSLSNLLKKTFECKHNDWMLCDSFSLPIYVRHSRFGVRLYLFSFFSYETVHPPLYFFARFSQR